MEINVQKSYLQGLPNQQAAPHNGKRIIIIHNTATPEATAKMKACISRVNGKTFKLLSMPSLIGTATS